MSSTSDFTLEPLRASLDRWYCDNTFLSLLHCRTLAKPSPLELQAFQYDIDQLFSLWIKINQY